MANEEQLARLKKDIGVWNEWRKNNPAVKINLYGVELIAANLREADLSHANLSTANFAVADLSETDLHEANLSHANFSGTEFILADLREADLSYSILSNADLYGADLRGADLRQTDLSGADLRHANLSHVDLSQCSLGGATLGDVDLSQVKGLETVKHSSPSTIGIDSIYKSKGDIPEVFLRGCGVPDNLIEYMHSLTGRAFDFYSCFISHSAKYKPFCERLYADLQAKGVRTWYFPEDAKWGETVWGEIDRGIKIYDKLVIVLSENSLQSKPVLREVQRSLDREDKEHKNILFPIRIDDYIFDKWEHERKVDVLEKVVGDFSGWDKDAVKYQKAFDKLLKGLQAEDRKE